MVLIEKYRQDESLKFCLPTLRTEMNKKKQNDFSFEFSDPVLN